MEPHHLRPVRHPASAGRLNDSRFTTFDLPLPGEATRLVDTLSDGRIIVACGEDVYVLTLPRGNLISGV